MTEALMNAPPKASNGRTKKIVSMFSANRRDVSRTKNTASVREMNMGSSRSKSIQNLRSVNERRNSSSVRSD